MLLPSGRVSRASNRSGRSHEAGSRLTGHPTVFVTSRPPIHQRLALEAAPDELDVMMLVSPSTDEICAAVAEAEFLISERSGVIDSRIIDAGRGLQLIQRLGSQAHDIDLDAADAADVPVCTWPVPHSSMVAEHVVMQMLTLAKRAREGSDVVVAAGDEWGPPQRSDADTFAINWSGRTGIRQIRDSTVGIVGLGEIGTEVARLLRIFDCTLLYNRRNRLPDWIEGRLGVSYAALDELLARSDFVCLLLPHSPETEGIADAGFVARMRPGSFLISAGASTLLDEEAVAQGYTSGHLAGVATDGYRWEPVRSDNPLVVLAADPRANVVLTPHAAQADLVLNADLRRGDYTNLVATLEGRPLRHRLT